VALTVRFRPEARAEARETREWYEARQSSLGAAFTEDLAHTVRSIAENPLRFSRVHQETRRGILTRFPYAVYFRANDDEVVVLAVHGRQDPARWKRRS
jgi:toxin ParE1/3/4